MATRSAQRALCLRSPFSLPPAYFLTDPDRTPNLLDISSRLPSGWGVVYRHFGAKDRFDTLGKIIKIARSRNLFVSASYDPDLLAAFPQAGAHLPKTTLKVMGRVDVQKIAAQRLVTTSAHSRCEIQLAIQKGAEACFVSAVFSSNSPSAPRAMGARRFRQLARWSEIPVYGLGGVSSDKTSQIAPHAGFAMVEGVTQLV